MYSRYLFVGVQEQDDCMSFHGFDHNLSLSPQNRNNIIFILFAVGAAERLYPLSKHVFLVARMGAEALLSVIHVLGAHQAGGGLSVPFRTDRE